MSEDQVIRKDDAHPTPEQQAAMEIIASVGWRENEHRPGTVTTFSAIPTQQTSTNDIRNAMNTLGYQEYESKSTGGGRTAFSANGSVMYGSGGGDKQHLGAVGGRLF